MKKALFIIPLFLVLVSCFDDGITYRCRIDLVMLKDNMFRSQRDFTVTVSNPDFYKVCEVQLWLLGDTSRRLDFEWNADSEGKSIDITIVSLYNTSSPVTYNCVLQNGQEAHCVYDYNSDTFNITYEDNFQ